MEQKSINYGHRIIKIVIALVCIGAIVFQVSKMVYDPEDSLITSSFNDLVGSLFLTTFALIIYIVYQVVKIKRKE